MRIRAFVPGIRAVSALHSRTPAPGGRRWRAAGLRLAAAAAVLLGAAAAQVAPPALPAGNPATAGEAAAELTFARLVAEQAPLRCWPSAVAAPPVFEEALVKDQVVAVGRSENGFRAIVLPLGPVGYVSQKFTTTRADGAVVTKGVKVSFRHRPRSAGEPPVAQLADGTLLHVLGEQDDWFRVRAPGVEAWVAETDVQLLDAADPTARAAYAAWQQQQQAEVTARLEQLAAQQQRARQDELDLAAVQVVQDAFTAELAKPAGAQDLQPLTTALTQLVATFDEQSAGRPAVEQLQKRITTQQWIAEATAARDARPPLAEEPPPPPPKDQLERFQSIGWLRYERRLAGPGVYYLEKGGQQQYLLSCNTGRYDLAMFVGREVGVIGPRRRPSTMSLSVLDVERLEVLGTTAR